MTGLALSRTPRMMFGVSLSTLGWFVMFLVTLDGWMTLRLLEAEVGREINPFMAWVVKAHGREAFMLVKLALSGACLLWVNRRASTEQLRVATLVALAIYLPIAGIHIANTQHLLGRLF